MLSADLLRSPAAPPGDVLVMPAAIPSPELSRFLYTAVGGPWFWTGRLGWDYARWLTYLDRPAISTLVLYASGTQAGYMEAEAQADGNVEVAQFGLLPRFIGQRLGGYFLSTGVARLWTHGARRVWLHTCTLDGPHALANYRARGFEEYDQKTEFWDLPDFTPGPWPNAVPSASSV